MKKEPYELLLLPYINLEEALRVGNPVFNSFEMNL